MDVKKINNYEEEEQEEEFVVTIKEEPELLIDNCDDEFSGENEAAAIRSQVRSNNQNSGKRVQLFNAIDFVDVSPLPKQSNCTLKQLLQEFKLANTYAALDACGFTYDRLRYINKDDLDVVFPGFRNTGLKAELREKIFCWKAKNFPEDVATTTTIFNSKVVNWVQAQDFTLSETPTSSQEDNNLMSSIKTQVLEILQASFAGQGLLSNYRKKKQLNSDDRKKLLSVIIEHCYDAATNRHTIPRPGQMENIAEQIVKIFPTESKDIYYIPRKIGLKHNPSGMLFNRFNNLNRKRKTVCEDRETNAPNKQESDSSAKADAKKPEVKYLQDKMKFMSSDDSDAMELWRRTYSYRCRGNQNLKDLGLILEEWPFYTQSEAICFIDYDFEMMYPDKSTLLFDNWPELADKLIKYYKEHLKDRTYKIIFQSLDNTSVDKNCRDCILFMLLHAVLKPTNRTVTKKKDGKFTVNRTTIKDGIYSCMVHVDNINDLEMARETKLRSYKDKEPYLIVIGPELHALSDFYVNYGGTLKKFSTFMASLDFCFKLFHIFHLQYPTESPIVWLFLQKYIFDIVTADDIKSHVLSEFLENVKH